MSHYAVAVIHRIEQDIDDMLAPFYEDLEIEFDEDDGYGYNPDAKWDWYCIGGRWSGLLRLKDGTRCDEAALKDVDFTPNHKDYDKHVRWWEVVVDGDELREGEDAKDFSSWYRREYYVDRFGTKDDYATERVSFSTYAILTPYGDWLEPGTMGWFGVSSATGEEEQAFAKNYMGFINRYLDEDEDYLITIVDCHI